ncbi:MAG: TolC family protein [Tannerellaceae bacterium]|nr:TolC family protein [Tannerellaceae bacterium]
MKNNNKHILFIVLLGLLPLPGIAQDTLYMTLPQAVEMARQDSPDAIAARHTFRAAYWNWRSFKANLLPSITFLSNPYLNRSISSVPLEDGSEVYVHRNQLSMDAGITINQNIPFTGGSLFVSTSLERLDLFTDKTNYYKTTPVVIGYEQNLFGYNQFKWDKRIEPLRYTEAKKVLVETLELVAARTTFKFFELAVAQSSWERALYNYANADTLYQFAQGRYDIGTITENEMLQLELNLLTEQTNIMNTRITVDDQVQELRSYLGIHEAVEIVVLTSDRIPTFHIPVDEALKLAYTNNPEPENMQRLRLESESNVAYAKSQRGFKADLYMQFGLTQSARQLKEAYRNPLDQQLVSVGIRLPILDWGVGKGKVKVAISNRDKVYTQVEQQRIDFESNIIKLVKQFNIQGDKVTLAFKTDQTAQRRNDVARRLYLLGKSDILDLNAAINEKNNARHTYIMALYNYWNLYYGIRSLTGYDFETHQALTENYQLLMK